MERQVEQTVLGRNTTDGDGVALQRILSYPQIRQFDPFLMLDSFQTSERGALPGFPWHPHRGILTITYMVTGEMEHQDSLGNHGIVGAGGVQWMRAASGIIHTEQPIAGENGIRGYQFWVNLASEEKMSDPDYGDIPASAIPTISPEPGIMVSVIAGEYRGVSGPLSVPRVGLELLVITLDPGKSLIIPAALEKNFFTLLIEGELTIDATPVTPNSANLLSSGTTVTFTAQARSQIILAGAVPLGEPIVWEGPIVMNSREEIELAFREFRDGTFVKRGSSPL